jgi:methylmalonyl-CoA mutase, N-terminal domain
MDRRSETGIPIATEYGPEAAPSRGDAERLGTSGAYPFTRHIYAGGARERPPAPSLYSGFGTPEDANRRFRYLLAQGNGRANCAVDLPTQIGLDSDDERAAGEVGRVGSSVDSLADLEVMFDGIPLDKTPVSFNVNTIAPIILAMLVVTARRQGVATSALTGTIANDPLHEYIARGTWRYPPEASLRLMADVAEYSVEHMPRFFPFNIRSILLHESGAHPGQEIGITFAIACRYIDELVGRGLHVDAFAPKMSFFFGAGLHILEEAAKFRAARRLWARLLRDRYGAQNPSSQKLRLTSVAPCGSHLTATDPQLNLVRNALGVLSGILGGVQAMLGTTIDEAYDIPTEETQRLALRTQQIVALESDVCATADPLGGSYFVEALTDEIEAAAVREMERYGGAEGIVEAIAAGGPQAALAARAYDLEQQIQDGRRPKVGVNVHRDSAASQKLRLHEPDLGLWEQRTRDLADLRARRDADQVEACLERVAAAAAGSENIVPVLIEAVEQYATVGELSAVMDTVFGAYVQPVVA